MSKVIRVSNCVNEQMLARSVLDVAALERAVKHDLIQQLVHTLYDSEVKTRPATMGTCYYIELNIVSNDELDLLERAKR